MAAYGGNEFSAGVTVAAWLLCEALGAWLAGRARSSFIVHRPSFLSALSVLSSLAAVPLAVLVRPLLGILPGETLSIPLLLLSTFAVVLLPAATHGALFVTAAALKPQGIGSSYVWEGIGTVLAGVACFLVLNRLPSLAVVALFSLPLAVATFRPPTPRRWPRRPRSDSATLIPSLLLAVAVAAVVLALPIERLAWGAAWRGQQVVAIVNSPYGKTIRLERTGQQLVLYDGLPVLTVPATQTERIEELSLLPVLSLSAPRHVLVLGSDLSIPAALARLRQDIAVTTVQLDPVLARTSLAAMTRDPSLIPPRFALTISDPASFLRATRHTFDCIIVTDAVPSNLGTSRLFSLEFYRLCRSRLAPGGLLAVAAPGNPTGLSPDLAGTIATRQHALGAAFKYVLPLAADFPLLLASDRPLNVSAESMLARLSDLSPTPQLLDSSYVASLLDPFRQHALASQIADRYSPSALRHSSAASPRELFLNMVRENRLVSPAFGALYARLGDLSPHLLLLLGGVLLALGLIGARVRGSRFSRGFAILTSGFSGAAASSLLIFAWQVRFGSVYSGVALLVAAFMLGTVLGGTLGTRLFLLHPSSLLFHPFLVSDLVLAACAAATMVLIRGGPAVVFLVANCLAGACLGFQFAVAGFIAHRSSLIASAPEATARRAGALTALDLAGGSLGGIMTALVVVPIFGIGTAALAAGAVKLTSALAQLMPGRPVSQP